MPQHQPSCLNPDDVATVESEVRRRNIPKHNRYVILLLLHQEKTCKEIEVVFHTQSRSGKTVTAALLSRKTGVPERTAGKILKRNNLRPHLHQSFMVSNDPDYEAKATSIISATHESAAKRCCFVRGRENPDSGTRQASTQSPLKARAIRTTSSIS